MKKDECDWCGHKKNKHRKKLKCCLAHDYFNGSWTPCPCEGFVKALAKKKHLTKGVKDEVTNNDKQRL